MLIRDGDRQPAPAASGSASGSARRSPWKTRLEQDFDVRRYVFDSHLRAVDGFDALTFDGIGSSLTTSLAALSRRFRGLPLAGVLALHRRQPDRYGRHRLVRSCRRSIPSCPRRGASPRTSASARSRSARPISSRPRSWSGPTSPPSAFTGESIVAVVTDETGKDVERQEAEGDRRRQAAELSVPVPARAERGQLLSGPRFRRLGRGARPRPSRATTRRPSEQTLANNSRLVVVDQGGGPYRVLYVSGRPNWEFKFLRRALDDDDQVQLVGLIRIARRQPKFDFRSHASRSRPARSSTASIIPTRTRPSGTTSRSWSGSARATRTSCATAFPRRPTSCIAITRSSSTTWRSGFFTPDQLALLRNFVSQRGGGLLMLGGPDSFADGKYDRTPDRRAAAGLPEPAVRSRRTTAEYRLVLTREGWLQPWVRMRKTEDEEQQAAGRDAALPDAQPVGRDQAGGRGALARFTTPTGATAPALVAQQFGKGHVAALLIGDLWRWGLRRENPAESDLDRSWRQTVRWLVGDVPGRVEVSVRPKADSDDSPAVDLASGSATPSIGRSTTPRSPFEITPARRRRPDARRRARRPRGGQPTRRPTSPSSRAPTASSPTATAPDGSAVGEREAGWAAQPAADEFARLEPDREYLKSIASKTHGEVVDGDRLASFVASLSSRDAPDHRAVDLPPLAPTPLLPDRHRLPGGRMGPAARQRPGVTRSVNESQVE